MQLAASGFHLRAVTLEHATRSDLSQTNNGVHFASALDWQAVLASGYMAGVNRHTHKREILKLPAQPVDEANAPQSVPFASVTAGLGTRAGVLDTSAAVASARRAIVMLEQGNALVQAFDMSGSPAPVFGAGEPKLMPLIAKRAPFTLVGPPRAWATCMACDRRRLSEHAALSRRGVGVPQRALPDARP